MNTIAFHADMKILQPGKKETANNCNNLFTASILILERLAERVCMVH